MSLPPNPPEAPDGVPAVRRDRPPVRALAVQALVAAGLGVPLGLLWSWITPWVPVEVTSAGLRYADPQPEQVVAADVWFLVVGIGFGVAVALGAWLLSPRSRGPVGLVVLTVGLVAAGLLAWWVGREVGLGDYEQAVAAADPGTVVGHPPDLRVAELRAWPPRLLGLPLAPALAGAITYTLLAGWSVHPTLRPDRVTADEGAPDGDPWRA